MARSDDDGWMGEGVDPVAAAWCIPHVGDFGVEATLVAAVTTTGEYVAECWIDGAVAKSPPMGRRYDRAVIGVRPDGSATLLRAGYRENLSPPR